MRGRSGNSAQSEYLRLTGECGHIRITSLRRACQRQLHNRTGAYATKVVDSSAAPSTTYASKAVVSSSVVPSTDDSGPLNTTCASSCNLALCIFGLLPRYGRSPAFDVWLMEAVAQPSVQRHVLRANRHCKHDVFVHSWEAEPYKTAAVQRAYAPRRAEFGKRTDGRTGMFLSIERVLALRKEEEEARGVRYTWVVVTRFDAVWMAPLPLPLLNRHLFYVANWCVGRDASDRRDGAPQPTAQARQETCRPLQPFAPETHQKDGVPDYFFAGGAAALDAVFVGLSDAVVSGRLQVSGRSCCNHAILASRLKALQLWSRLGRVLVHHMDIETLRQPKFDLEGRWACAVEQAARKEATPPSSGCTPRPFDAGHWSWAADAESRAGQRARSVRDESAALARPSATSRCHPRTLRYCMCSAAQWSQYPQLTSTAP